jgi:hypothetical protein
MLSTGLANSFLSSDKDFCLLASVSTYSTFLIFYICFSLFAVLATRFIANLPPEKRESVIIDEHKSGNCFTALDK